MIDINKEYNENFTQPIIKTGRMTNLLAALLSFLPAITIWAYYGVIPSLGEILTGWFLIASVYGVYYIVEPLSYFPVVGLPGIYMVCLAGNIANMRIPSAAVAQEAVGVQSGTKEAELIATVGIAGSIITNLIVVSIAAFAGTKIMTLVPPIVREAFNYVTPAIYGSMFAMFAVKDYFLGSYALGITILMLSVLNMPTYFMIPIAVFSSILLAIKKSKKEINVETL